MAHLGLAQNGNMYDPDFGFSVFPILAHPSKFFFVQISIMSMERDNIPYTANYCEENCYQLASLRQEASPNGFIVFISNKSQKTPLWAHKKGQDKDTPIVWDYHVIYMELSEKAVVFDHDSILQFPETASKYIIETFRPSIPLREEYKQYYTTQQMLFFI